MNKEKELFSLETHFGGQVDQVGFIIKDVTITKDGRKAAMVFFTFKLKDADIEAQLPLDDSKDFKKHILAIVKQAIGLKKEKEAKKNK